jgi:hypothetical protein
MDKDWLFLPGRATADEWVVVLVIATFLYLLGRLLLARVVFLWAWAKC